MSDFRNNKIDKSVSRLSDNIYTDSYLKKVIYESVSESLFADGLDVSREEVCVCYEMGIALNGITYPERLVITNLVEATKMTVKWFLDYEDINPGRVCQISKVLTNGLPVSYDELMKHPSMVASRRKMSDKIRVDSTDNKNVCEIDSECANQLSSLCDSINEIADADSDRISTSMLYAKSFEAHQLVAACDILGDVTGRICRIITLGLQIRFRLPIKIVNKRTIEEYHQCAAVKKQCNSSVFIDYMLRNVEQSYNKKSHISKNVNNVQKPKEMQRKAKKSAETALQIEICKRFKDNPSITSRDIAKELNMSSILVRRSVTKMREAGILEHVGSNKGGEWHVKVPMPEY